MSDPVVEVATRDDLLAALRTAGHGGRAIALIGGADLTEAERLEDLRRFFGVLAAHAERTGTAVLDGGTDSGVMRLIGEARAALGGTFQLIGVAPGGAFGRETRGGDPIAPAPHHSVVLAVPGDEFGDEDELLFAAADHLNGGGAPTVVVNGGKLALEEAYIRLGLGFAVLAVAGSGRAADELAGAVDLHASLRLRVIPIGIDEAGLAAALEEAATP